MHVDTQRLTRPHPPDAVHRTDARHLRRPAMWRAPRAIVETLIGRERSSILLEGQRVVPRRALAPGYAFKFPALDAALSNLVKIKA
ncbi:MAG: DUF1731 domain-containing protein [Hyphomicrobiales bacterium]|nr:DUF1731 domain-containing protein [Hyphomicrobiales bacterium]